MDIDLNHLIAGALTPCLVTVTEILAVSFRPIVARSEEASNVEIVELSPKTLCMIAFQQRGQGNLFRADSGSKGILIPMQCGDPAVGRLEAEWLADIIQSERPYIGLNAYRVLPVGMGASNGLSWGDHMSRRVLTG